MTPLASTEAFRREALCQQAEARRAQIKAA